MMRRRVVLPQPEGPRKQTNSPLRMPRSISWRAVKAPNSLRMRRSSRNASELMREMEGMRPGRAASRLSPFFGLAVVALGPFVQDALAVVRGPAEVHLHQSRLVVLRH